MVYIMFNPQDWYWAVAGSSSTQVYSSASNTYVPIEDAAYVAWQAVQGGAATAISNEAEIWPYVSRQPLLRQAWLFNGTTFAQPSAGSYTAAQLIAYANTKQSAIMNGGISVNGIECATT